MGKVVNQYKVAKHFDLTIGDNAFTFARKTDAIAAEAAMDGIYIIRTSVSAALMDAPDCVRHYKSLANVERAFRSLKTIDLKVRPIHHRTADRVRAHIFLCMLAYYVEWHMREAWRELMFADTDQQYQGLRVMGLDGSTLEVPDEAANALYFGYAGTSRGGGGGVSADALLRPGRVRHSSARWGGAGALRHQRAGAGASGARLR